MGKAARNRRIRQDAILMSKAQPKVKGEPRETAKTIARRIRRRG
jgi:hypothetical protein